MTRNNALKWTGAALLIALICVLKQYYPTAYAVSTIFVIGGIFIYMSIHLFKTNPPEKEGTEMRNIFSNLRPITPANIMLFAFFAGGTVTIAQAIYEPRPEPHWALVLAFAAIIIPTLIWMMNLGDYFNTETKTSDTIANTPLPDLPLSKKFNTWEDWQIKPDSLGVYFGNNLSPTFTARNRQDTKWLAYRLNHCARMEAQGIEGLIENPLPPELQTAVLTSEISKLRRLRAAVNSCFMASWNKNNSDPMTTEVLTKQIRGRTLKVRT